MERLNFILIVTVFTSVIVSDEAMAGGNRHPLMTGAGSTMPAGRSYVSRSNASYGGYNRVVKSSAVYMGTSGVRAAATRSTVGGFGGFFEGSATRFLRGAGRAGTRVTLPVQLWWGGTKGRPDYAY